MSSIYTKLRDDIVAGTAGDSKQPSRSNSLFAVVVLGLLIWLGVKNPWALVFLVGLIASVFLHELAHFVTAKRCGMKVTQFYMGVGSRVWSTQRGEVEFGLRALPIGAFVRIIGMNNLDQVDPADELRTYRQQSFPKRFFVITAGSLMHMLIGLTLLVGVYGLAGRYGDTGELMIYGDPAKNSPAEESGIIHGDHILAIDSTQITSRNDLVLAIVANQPGDTVEIKLLRDGQQLIIPATLSGYPGKPETAYLGVASDSYEYIEQDIFSAVGHGVADVVLTAGSSVTGVVAVLNPINIFSNVFTVEPDQTTRPTTIVGATQIGGEVGRSEGLKGVLLMLASVNVFIGVFNMIPVLPFDGGHAAIAVYERLRSRRGRKYHADFAKMVPVAVVAVGLLAMLMVFGLYLDITNPLGL